MGFRPLSLDICFNRLEMSWSISFCVLFSMALRGLDVLAQLHIAGDTCLSVTTPCGMKGNTVFPLSRETQQSSQTPCLEP